MINVRLTDVECDRPMCCCWCCFTSKACPMHSSPARKSTHALHCTHTLWAACCSASVKDLFFFLFSSTGIPIYPSVHPLSPFSPLGSVNKLGLCRPLRIPPPPTAFPPSNSHACSGSAAALYVAEGHQGDARIIHWAILNHIVHIQPGRLTSASVREPLEGAVSTPVNTAHQA